MMTDVEMEIEIRDSLLNSEARIGGRVGVASDETLEVMQAIKLIGPTQCLTRKGVGRALRIQREEGWR